MNEIKDGIVYCDPPLVCDVYSFLLEHLDCDCVIRRQDMNADTFEILAYSTSEDYNFMLCAEFCDNDDCIIMQHIDSKGVNSID